MEERIKKKEIYLSLGLLEKFQNLELSGNKLRYKLRKPFDSMIKIKGCLSWCWK